MEVNSNAIVTNIGNGTVDHKDCIEDFKYILFVHLKYAKNLPMRTNKITKTNESIDSFVKFVVGQKVVHKTKTVVKDSNPTWDESFMIVVPDLSTNLEIKVTMNKALN